MIETESNREHRSIFQQPVRYEWDDGRVGFDVSAESSILVKADNAFA